MNRTIAIIAVIALIGCAGPTNFQMPAGTGQPEFRDALISCGGNPDGNDGYFLFGPLIILAPVVAIVEGIKYGNKQKVRSCMESKGYRCTANCYH